LARVFTLNGRFQENMAVEAFTRDSSRPLKRDSNFISMIASSDRDADRGASVTPDRDGRATGRTVMAILEMVEFTSAGLGTAAVSADTMFELGMMYASGREVPVDLVSAHKWFNIAAMKGHGEAALLRREVAAEMQDAEIGQAQRAARDWLKTHPEPVAQQPMVLRAAA
jgi:TPR repeat protein